MRVAKKLLGEWDLSWTDMVRLVLEMLEGIQWGEETDKSARINRLRLVMRAGLAEDAKARNTKTFGETMMLSIKERAGRRPSTRSDLRYLAARLCRFNAGAETRPLRGMTQTECRQLLDRAFHTPAQWRKGRAFLSSIFSYGEREGLCAVNPVLSIPIPEVKEREIRALPLEAVMRLTRACRMPQFNGCAAAVGLMLWAGIRPQELVRLRWEQVDLEEGVICVQAEHSKTGGARLVKIHPVLHRWLCRFACAGRLLPANWRVRWRKLRQECGLVPWRADTLRHTYASYHAKKWRDINALSMEMGHRDTRLLRTRYINLQGLSHSDADTFWTGSWL